MATLNLKKNKKNNFAGGLRTVKISYQEIISLGM